MPTIRSMHDRTQQRLAVGPSKLIAAMTLIDVHRPSAQRPSFSRHQSSSSGSSIYSSASGSTPTSASSGRERARSVPDHGISRLELGSTKPLPPLSSAKTSSETSIAILAISRRPIGWLFSIGCQLLWLSVTFAKTDTEMDDTTGRSTWPIVERPYLDADGSHPDSFNA